MIRTMTAAIAVSTAIHLPVLLVGALGVLIQADLGFGPSELGMAVAAYFAAAAAFGAPAGRIAEARGPVPAVWAGTGLAVIALVGLGSLAASWEVILVLMLFGGLGNSSAQLGINTLLARVIPRHRFGVAFGAKQASVPLASILSGLALPILGLTAGWRWAFIAAGVVVAFAALALPRRQSDSRRAGDSVQPGDKLGALVMLAAGVGLAGTGGNAAAAFIVGSAVNHGLTPTEAGLLLALGGLTAIGTRMISGWIVDVWRHRSLHLVVGLVALGVIGYCGLAVAEEPLAIVGVTICAFAGGSGFAGLVLVAVADSNPSAPGRAMGIVQTGPMVGAVVGPLLFGFVAANISFESAWLAMAILGSSGAALIMFARPRIGIARAQALSRISAPASDETVANHGQ